MFILELRKISFVIGAIACGSVFCVSSLAQTPTSPSTIFRKAQPSIVLIVGGDESGKPTVQGSGFIIGPDRVVTNHHVVAGTSTALAVFSDGGSSPITGVIADNAAKDLIILGAVTGQRPALAIGDELSLQQGDPVYAIGAPQGLELTLTNGIVSAFRNIGDQFLIQSTAAIGHGSSGGPLFDQAGRVIGITSAFLSDTPGIYFSVGAGELKRLLRSPQSIVLSFTEWAKQNPGQPVSAEDVGSPTPPKNAKDYYRELLKAGEFYSTIRLGQDAQGKSISETLQEDKWACFPDDNPNFFTFTAWHYDEEWAKAAEVLGKRSGSEPPYTEEEHKAADTMDRIQAENPPYVGLALMLPPADKFPRDTFEYQAGLLKANLYSRGIKEGEMRLTRLVAMLGFPDQPEAGLPSNPNPNGWYSDDWNFSNGPARQTLVTRLLINPKTMRYILDKAILDTVPGKMVSSSSGTCEAIPAPEK